MRTCFLSLLVLALAAVAAAQAPLEVHFIDVGQGDATLVVAPSGRTLLIDGGADGLGAKVVVPLLKTLKITSLTAMVATHYDGDHIGGLDEVVAAGFRPQAAYDRGTFLSAPTTKTTYKQYVAAVGSARRTLAPGTVIDLGGGVTAECLVVNGMVKNGPTIDLRNASLFENAASAGLVIRYGKFQLWVGGDVPGGGFGRTDVETWVARTAGDLDVVQVNHHGSDDSTNWTFLYATSPEVAVISAGDNNPYGHPHTEVLARLGVFPTVAAVLQTTPGAHKPGGTWAYGTIRLRTSATGYTVDGGVLAPRTFPYDESLPPPPHPRQVGDLVVTEFLANPYRVSDALGEYVEIRNTTAHPLDLIGLTLSDEGVDAVHIEQSVPVPAGGSVIVAREADPRVNGGFVPDLVVSEYYLANSADEIRLDDPWGTALDVVRYGAAGFTPLSGVAFERKNPAAAGTAANFARAVSSFGSGDLGTPGNPNDADPNFAAHIAVTGGVPLPGQTLSLRLVGPASRTYILVPSALRVDTALPGNVRLGVGLDLLALAFVLPGWIGTLPTASATVSLPIPAASVMSGRTFYLQLVIISSSGLPESVSDVARVVVG